MSVQSVLSEVVKHCSMNGVEVIKITGSDTAVRVQCHDADKTLFVEGDIPPLDDFRGEFGITNIKMLSGLLGFSHYQDSAFKINTRKKDGETVPFQIQFKGRGSKSLFNLMDANYIPKQATIPAVPWGVTLSEVTKEMLTEFQQFAGLYAEIDKFFSISVVDDAIMITFGQEASSTHSGSMKLADAGGQTLNSTLSFPVDKFIALMKLAVANETAKLMFTDKGLLGIDLTSEHGVYRYYLRQTVR